ncbi:6-carboxyhexanoate--CoA ligase [Paraclostridium bifermentans]|uniref:6-carboxyhexanoate--CoA ligase n=1 Tax=Paraclostridium bifermentans TaxID=1490 RepID=UPI0006B30758|nr:6-carboxyhexanoate--CoA ligase [Paraclostridium bifermentans]
MKLYSVKMRSSKMKGNLTEHISGAESISNEENLEEVISLLIKRAFNHPKGKSDFINIKLEEISKEEITYIEPLPVTTVNVENYLEGFNILTNILENMGIDKIKSDNIVRTIRSISNMRGAILLDINTFQRLETDKQRGIRATYMDFEGNDMETLNKSIEKNAHFLEALVLASKVVSCEQIIGEVCYSDDPNYTAGYVASKKYGYVRITHLKDIGDTSGGRIFLYDSSLSNKSKCIEYIENKKIIVKNDIKLNESISYKDFINGKKQLKNYL